MRASILSAAAALLASVNAIQILTPTKNEAVDLNDQSYTVTWQTVSTDPTSAHLLLVNQAGGHAQYSKDFGEIDLTKGSYTVAAFSVPVDTAYQFNLQSFVPNNMGILAQSQQFNITKSSSSSSGTTTSSASSSAKTGGAGTSPDVSSGSASSTTMSTAASTSTGTTTGSSNSTTTGTASKTTTTSGANKLAGGFLALGLGAVALVL